MLALVIRAMLIVLAMGMLMVMETMRWRWTLEVSWCCFSTTHSDTNNGDDDNAGHYNNEVGGGEVGNVVATPVGVVGWRGAGASVCRSDGLAAAPLSARGCRWPPLVPWPAPAGAAPASAEAMGMTF